MSRVLLVDDEPRFSQVTGEVLRGEGHEVITANCLAAARNAIDNEIPEFVLLDLKLPDGNGLELLGQFGDDWQGHIVIITGDTSIQAHIHDLAGPDVTYLTKPVESTDILRLLEYRQQIGAVKSMDPAMHFGLLIGESEPMQRIYDETARFGPTGATVLIVGESGTGKELVARALHEVSGRKGQFVPVNCGAVARDLIATELFGHEKGSFTGATRRHVGAFERASGGTLLLDEISEMPVDMQTFLLRSLESGEITRVGSEESTPIDARLIAATNRPLSGIVAEEHLREDLYYRLGECVIRLPPLRARGDDTELLVRHMVDDLNSRYGCAKPVADEFLERCRSHSWPGNVRELRHSVHRAFLLADGADEPVSGDSSCFQDAPVKSTSNLQVEPGDRICDVERELILKTLEHFDGDRQATVDSLGISLRTLYNRLKDYEQNSTR